MRLSQAEGVKSYYVDGGFVQVRDNVVTVLTARAIPAKEIKIAEAEQTLRPHAIATTPEGQEASKRRSSVPAPAADRRQKQRLLIPPRAINRHNRHGRIVPLRFRQIPSFPVKIWLFPAKGFS